MKSESASPPIPSKEEPRRTVREDVLAVDALRDALMHTSCAVCGHAYIDHGLTVAHLGKCWHPRIMRDGAAPCNCKRFVDPAETLQGVTGQHLTSGDSARMHNGHNER